MKVVIEDKGEMEEILRRAPVGRLGLVDEAEAYIVPLNFAYGDGCIYFHAGIEGRKLDIIGKNPRACFEVDEVSEIIINREMGCMSTAHYESVIAWGNARLLDSAEEKMSAIDLIMQKYAKDEGYEPIPEPGLAIICVVEIKIDKMTGKKNVADDA
jgi:hypothetical protein